MNNVEQRGAGGSEVYQERYTEISGVNICYIDEGKGPVVLLVHGLEGTLSNWDPTIDFLKRDFRVIALDLPCFGKSDLIEADLTPDYFSRTIISLLDLLGVKSVIVAGHSMGGVVALNLVLFHRERVNGLVLVDAAGSHRIPRLFLSMMSAIANTENAGKMSRFAANPEKRRRFTKYRFGQRLAGIYHSNEYTEALINNGVDILEGRDINKQMQAVFKSGRQTLSVSYFSMLGQIDVPALILWGRKDPFLSFKSGQRFNNEIRGSMLTVIPDAGHIPQLEQPELFNDALRRFLVGACDYMPERI